MRARKHAPLPLHAPTRPRSHAWVPAYLAYPLPLDATSPSERLLGKRCNSRQGPGVGTLARVLPPVGTKLARPHGHLTSASRCNRRERSSMRRSRETTQCTPRTNLPASHAQHAADLTSPHACRAAVSTRKCPAPVRAAGPRVAGARAPLRISARLAQRHATSAHQFAAPQPVKGSRHAPASLLPLQEKDAPVRHCACAAGFSARPSGPRKNRRDRRPHRAAASARPCCTLLHTHDCKNVKKAPWSACKAARSGGARTAFPRREAPREPDSPTYRPRQTRRVDLAAVAADRLL